jgi:two-component system response regulator AtoC
MAAETILIVDDEPLQRWGTREQLRAWGYQVIEADTAATALDAYKTRSPEAVLLDLRLGEESGLDVLRDIRALDNEAAVFMVTARGDVDDAVSGFRLGLTDFFRKPLDYGALRAALRYRLENRRLRELAQRNREAEQRDTQIVGSSTPILDALRVMRRVASSNASVVLLQGESGTGKDLFAKELHDCSARSSEPFIAVNCAALPEALLESELFGHERGAFTDARSTKRGLFELANGGTLYLDEIGELKMALQAKLLRAIETLSFRRVGGVQDISIDTRVIAASNRDLEQAVKDGTFRADLFYRLGVVRIVLPPLRQRSEDIPRLVKHLVTQISARLGRQAPTVSQEAMDALSRHEWPGNVRELRNTLERALILEDGDLLTAVHLFGDTGATVNATDAPAVMIKMPPDGLSLERVEEDLVRQAMALAQGNQSRAARLLDIGRDALRYKLKKFQIEGGEDAPTPGGAVTGQPA